MFFIELTSSLKFLLLFSLAARSDSAPALSRGAFNDFGKLCPFSQRVTRHTRAMVSVCKKLTFSRHIAALLVRKYSWQHRLPLRLGGKYEIWESTFEDFFSTPSHYRPEGPLSGISPRRGNMNALTRESARTESRDFLFRRHDSGTRPKCVCQAGQPAFVLLFLRERSRV